MIELSGRRHAHSRRRPIQAVVLIGVFATGIWLGVAFVHAYDTRLHEALAALQKAAALVEASSAGDVSGHTQHKFDHERRKALASIQDAMDHIVAAGLTADSDGGSH
jgi:Ni,Fe-hydrogenase I cytochrome b subunit